ncbi:glycosyltransferase [Synechocystis sp. LKSZ1]|uniref:glycosyltransferase n=1 Tax=Synechocystis sp. LKSZ1 TaxID=3144951 RepID=UPI00336BBE23
MKINWFSPLPPAKTDIANYSLRLLPSLQEHSEVTLWTTDPDYEPPLEGLASVEVYRPDDLPWRKIHLGDINFYNIGNNRQFHQSIWQISQYCPGIVILHDWNLYGLFSEIYKAHPDLRDYFRQLLYYYEAEAPATLDCFDGKVVPTPEQVEQFPLTALALRSAKGVISHSRYAYQRLLDQNPSLTGYVPLPYAAPASSVPKPQLSPPYSLIIFGFISKNRHLDRILEALAQFPQRQAFRLDIYGELWDTQGIQDQIKALSLEDFVTVRGFVPEVDLEAALAKAALALNLRYPTMGEASASQLRIWSHGLPSLVTPIGWYGQLPEQTVGNVRLGQEIEDIHYHLQSYLDHPETYQSMGVAGQAWLVEHHDPRQCAEAILAFAKGVHQGPLYPTVQYLTEKIIETQWPWLNPQETPLNQDSLAAALHFLTH